MPTHASESELDRVLESVVHPNADSLVDEQQARLLWRAVNGDDGHADQFLAALWTELALTDPQLQDSVQSLRGVWQLDVSVAAVRAVLLSAVLAAYLAIRGAPDFDIAVVSAALPFIVDVDRVSLSREDELTVMDVAWSDAARRAPSVEELFRQAPESLRDRMSIAEFTQLIDRLRDAGFADDRGGIEVTRRPRTTIRIR